MPSSKRTVDLVIQAQRITSDLLKSVFNEYLNGNADKKQQLSYGKLRQQGKLDNIEITKNNIADFRDVARKYDMQFALKRDKKTDPPTYHILFSSKDSSAMKRAFAEYAGLKQTEIMNTEKLMQNARIISAKQAEKDFERNKTLEIGGR